MGRALAVVCLLLASCIEASVVDCNDTICPRDRACVRGRCVDPQLAAACAEVAEGAACDAAPNGACIDGVCTTALCGDGARSLDEVCDDGASISGDGCSGDCRSTEVCGNQIADFAAGEQCDEGIAGLSGDGCSSTCLAEISLWLDHRNESERLERGAAITYDPVRGTLVMIGSGSHLSETWEWLYRPTTNHGVWIHREPSVSPPGRTEWSMSFDPSCQCVVAFSPGMPSATWEWNGISWRDRAPVTAPAGTTGGIAYDEQRARLVLYTGGRTWEWEGGDWSEKVTVESPPSDPMISIAYDRNAHAVMVNGYYWDGSTWTSTGRPLGSLVFDPAANVMRGFETSAIWAWDGTDLTFDDVATPAALFAYHGALGKIVSFDGDTVAVYAPSTTPRFTPRVELEPRDGIAAMAYDSRRAAVVLWTSGLTVLGDNRIWEWSGTGWSLRYDVGGFRSGHQLVFDEERGNLVGTDAEVTVNGPVALSPPPVGAYASALVYDPIVRRTRLVAIGTTATLEGTAWTAESNDLAATPTGPIRAVFVPQRQRFVAYLIEAGSGVIFESADARSWQRSSVSPPTSSGAALQVDPRRGSALLIDGIDARVFEWDGTTWSERVAAGVAPTPRGRTHAAYDDSRARILVWTNIETWSVGYAVARREACLAPVRDEDGDGLVGCTDPDCRWACP